MAKTKRLRIFVGPNGSGKSTLFENIASTFPTGHFINSDLIESEITKTGFINLEKYELILTQEDFDVFCQLPASISLLKKSHEEGHEINIEVKENVIVDKSKESHSYEASLVTAFIRQHLMNAGISYSFESVMSHPSKLDEIQHAQELGYKTYLYFVCTEDPLLNVSRVSNRIEKGGHAVAQDKIVARYFRTLELLLPAIFCSDKCYLFDNSTQQMTLIAQVKDRTLQILVGKDRIPNWFKEYVVNRL